MTVLTLLGRGPSWKDCQFNTVELWGTLSNLIVPVLGDKSYTKLFAFDSMDDSELSKCLIMAKERDIPIVSEQKYGTERFNLIEISKKFRTSYFKPTMSYILAYAIYYEYKKIFIHGIDQGPQWNYQDGKTYITYWLGMANMAGVDVRLGPGSLKWQYKSGLENLPVAFVEECQSQICHYVGEEQDEKEKEKQRIYRNIPRIQELVNA